MPELQGTEEDGKLGPLAALDEMLPDVEPLLESGASGGASSVGGAVSERMLVQPEDEAGLVAPAAGAAVDRPRWRHRPRVGGLRLSLVAEAGHILNLLVRLLDARLDAFAKRIGGAGHGVLGAIEG